MDDDRLRIADAAILEMLDAPVLPASRPAPLHAPAERGRKREIKTGDLTRFEVKYLLHPAQVPLVRAFIQPWCRPDRNAKGDPPSYINTTLLLDSPTRACYQARCANALNRFKLRARVYATDGSSPVILEIKRKLGNQIVKTRSQVPFDRFRAEIFHTIDETLPFKNEERRQGYREFARLVQQIGAAPVILLRYRREPWTGVIDDYARVTLDSQLMYQPCRDWSSWGRGRCWRCFDQAQWPDAWSGTILELKCDSRVPVWMNDLVVRFDLQRRAICKYALAIETERRLLPDVLQEEWAL